WALVEIVRSSRRACLPPPHASTGEETARVMMRTGHENGTRREVFSATTARQNDPPTGLVGERDGSPNSWRLAPAARQFLDRLLEQQLLNADALVQFVEQMGEALDQHTDAHALGNA